VAFSFCHSDFLFGTFCVFPVFSYDVCNAAPRKLAGSRPFVSDRRLRRCLSRALSPLVLLHRFPFVVLVTPWRGGNRTLQRTFLITFQAHLLTESFFLSPSNVLGHKRLSSALYQDAFAPYLKGGRTRAPASIVCLCWQGQWLKVASFW